ncbi:uncharacterized protein LOC126398150 [Epinephelus moara]|uniref:uncharacterized protein LOC126398150 n=1 Tax=Epinephelus moara TaxID=300413 RepID=UPI00214F0177|nr:uncharacterized protein LOC126398150 [Epinephelus moara]
MAAFKGRDRLREDRDAGMGQALNLLLSCSLTVGSSPGLGMCSCVRRCHRCAVTSVSLPAACLLSFFFTTGRSPSLPHCPPHPLCLFEDLTVSNIARGGRVTQSSVAFGGVPKRAIDGNQASIYGQRSCTHTKRERKPWWRLDLLRTYKINTVTITNRKDCCYNRLNGAEIRIGNSLNDNGNANPRCAVFHSVQAGASKTFVCNGMEGQYVNIVIPGRPEYLTVCEVEVTGQVAGNPTPAVSNIARGGRVTQSSVAFGGVPKRAIDGNQASIYGQRSCTHTKRERKPWWRLDLLRTYKINTVTITNRKDCCHNRLNGAEIHIGNSLNDNGNANPRCAVIRSIPAGVSTTFVCNGMKGRYVNIVIPGRRKYLTLCEVEVIGTSTVIIINREDCCHNRLNGADICMGNSLIDMNGNTNPRCGRQCILSSVHAGVGVTDGKKAKPESCCRLSRLGLMNNLDEEPLTRTLKNQEDAAGAELCEGPQGDASDPSS